MIWDDQNVIVNVKNNGLVIVSGCSHAGAVNVLRNAQRLTGEQRLAAFIGGLHLTGGIFEPIIKPGGPGHSSGGESGTSGLRSIQSGMSQFSCLYKAGWKRKSRSVTREKSGSDGSKASRLVDACRRWPEGGSTRAPARIARAGSNSGQSPQRGKTPSTNRSRHAPKLCRWNAAHQAISRA